MADPGANHERTHHAGRGLRRAGTELDHEQPPPALAARVQAALQAALPTPPLALPPLAALLRQSVWPAWSGWSGWPGFAACAAVLVASVLLMLRNPAIEAATPELRLSGFLPVVPVEDWPASDAQAWLVSTELRRYRMAAPGLPFNPSRAADSVRAELLVRAPGEVLAVRFLQ